MRVNPQFKERLPIVTHVIGHRCDASSHQFADVVDGLGRQLADIGYQTIVIQGGATQKAEA
jgi:hypothetical protein